MKIKHEDIRNEKLDGMEVWICDYTWNDYHNVKPSAHIKPQRAIVRNNKDGCRGLGAGSHVVSLNVDGSISKAKNKIYYVSNFWVSTYNIFDNETECRKYYTEQCTKAIREKEKIFISQEKYYKDFEARTIKTIQEML